MTAAAPTNLEDPFPSSLDSFEGVPDFVPERRAGSLFGTDGWAHRCLTWAGDTLPGLALAFALAWTGYLLSDWLGRRMSYEPGKSPVSPVTIAVLLGLI